MVEAALAAGTRCTGVHSLKANAAAPAAVPRNRRRDGEACVSSKGVPFTGRRRAEAALGARVRRQGELRKELTMRQKRCRQ